MPKFLFNNTTGCKVRCKKCKVIANISDGATPTIELKVSGKKYNFKHSDQLYFNFGGKNPFKEDDLLFIKENGATYSIFRVMKIIGNGFHAELFYITPENRQINSCIKFTNFNDTLKGTYNYLPKNKNYIKKINLNLTYSPGS